MERQHFQSAAHEEESGINQKEECDTSAAGGDDGQISQEGGVRETHALDNAIERTPEWCAPMCRTNCRARTEDVSEQRQRRVLVF